MELRLHEKLRWCGKHMYQAAIVLHIVVLFVVARAEKVYNNGLDPTHLLHWACWLAVLGVCCGLVSLHLRHAAASGDR